MTKRSVNLRGHGPADGGLLGKVGLALRELDAARLRIQELEAELDSATTRGRELVEEAEAEALAQANKAEQLRNEVHALAAERDRVRWRLEETQSLAEERAVNIGHWKASNEEFRASIGQVRQLLEYDGCSCDCDCGPGEHDDECDRCLACRIEIVIGKYSLAIEPPQLMQPAASTRMHDEPVATGRRCSACHAVGPCEHRPASSWPKAEERGGAACNHQMNWIYVASGNVYVCSGCGDEMPITADAARKLPYDPSAGLQRGEGKD